MIRLLSVVSLVIGLVYSQFSVVYANQANSAVIQSKLEVLVKQKQTVLDELDQIKREKAVLQAYMQQLSLLKDKKGVERLGNESLYVDGTAFQQSLVSTLLLRLQAFEDMLVNQPKFLQASFKTELDEVQAVIAKDTVTIVDKAQLVFEFTQKHLSQFSKIQTQAKQVTVGQELLAARVLSLGLIGHYFVSLHDARVAYWTLDQAKWVYVSGQEAEAIKSAVSVANSESTPTIIALPVTTKQLSTYAYKQAADQPSTSTEAGE